MASHLAITCMGPLVYLTSSQACLAQVLESKSFMIPKVKDNILNFKKSIGNQYFSLKVRIIVYNF